MEPFTVDKSFYDIGTSDLKELWESDLDPDFYYKGWNFTGYANETISEVLRAAAGDAEMAEWTGFLQATPSVVLHDRLMTDAALGAAGAGAGAGAPIKTEHSYCSLDNADIDPNADGDADSSPDSEMSALSASMDDMDDECFPCIPMKNATTQRPMHEDSKADITVKDEPLSEPASPASSCPMSPDSSASSTGSMASPPPLAPPPPPPPLSDSKVNVVSSCSPTSNGLSNLSNGSAPHQQSLLKQPAVLISTRNSLAAQNRVVMPKLNIKVESSSGFSLPPTPPSSTASDSEGNDLHPSSPSNRQQQQVNSRLLLSPPPSSGSTRQPIQTSLISSQPKGSTGMLLLTDEEKRTLLAEGYPIPTRLPLTKAEEKSLKKIRRKIKNKISAQESRRKKKEYMDALERKVEILTSENTDYRKKIESLEDSNDSLISQLNKLQALVARASSGNATMIAAAAAVVNGSAARGARHTDPFSHSLSSQALARSSVK